VKLPLAAWLLLDALAVFRLTRLVNADSILDGPRQTLLARRWTRTYLFVTCPWCVSVWAAVVVVILTVNAGTWWSWVAAVLAGSAVGGLLSEWSH
jgi:hypothetical protein